MQTENVQADTRSILLILCALGAHAKDGIKVNTMDPQALMQRVEQLEHAQAHPNK